MDTVTILASSDRITRTYDEGADVLYLSVGEPRPAIGVDIGDGIVLRYDEARNEIVGLTVIGLKDRLRAGLQDT